VSRNKIFPSVRQCRREPSGKNEAGVRTGGPKVCDIVVTKESDFPRSPPRRGEIADVSLSLARLLEENRWMVTYFAEERKWKPAAAETTSNLVLITARHRRAAQRKRRKIYESGACTSSGLRCEFQMQPRSRYPLQWPRALVADDGALPDEGLVILETRRTSKKRLE